MGILDSLIAGISSLLTFYKLFWITIGGIIGTLIGALPGIGPNAGVAILMPFTFSMPADVGLLLLISIYMGCTYGGRISSILLNTPGDASAVMTCMDGYPLMKQGKGGVAMGVSCFSSFIGGTIGNLVMTFLAPLVAAAAFVFGPPEYFSVMLFSLVTISVITQKASAKGLVMITFGLLMAMVGADYVSGQSRLTFGIPYLLDGIDFVPVAIGLFGLSEVIEGMEKPFIKQVVEYSLKYRSLFPSWKDIKTASRGTFVGTAIGVMVGMLPGAGVTIASFIAYGVAKKTSSNSEMFGKGSLEGLAAPEAADNACVSTTLTPMLSLGIPGSSVSALIMGGFIIHDLQPGPLMFIKTPDIAWAIIGGLYVTNLMLLITNTAMIPLFIRAIRAATPVLYPLIGALCIIGVYSLNASVTDVFLMFLAGIVGYLLRKGDYPIAGMLLALILGPLIENTFRQSLIMSGGQYSVFFTRPICLVLLSVTFLILVYPMLKKGLGNIRQIQFRG